jgi:hypothetical protein
MRRVELWTEDDRAPLRLDPRVISLEPIRRARHDDAVHNAYDEGTVVGFFLGIAAMALVWLVLSGLLLRVMIAVVGAVFWLLGVRT